VSRRRELVVGVVMLCCTVLVAFWMLASRYAARGFEPLRIEAGDFAGFLPSGAAWRARVVYVKSTPIEPTITAYELRRSAHPGEVLPAGADAPVLVRLVHGYNMVDCMRIKHYGVQQLRENLGLWKRVEAGEEAPASGAPPLQVWWLTEPDDGPGRVWASSMLQADDFRGTAVDTRDMAFPRVGVPDDPAYRPSGLRWRSLRHPARNFRLFLRSRWNASRMDLLTFLRLRRPAWASDVLLTMVSEYRGADAAERTADEMMEHVLAAHSFFYDALQRFHAARN
jgi:hypothetical protein